MSDRPNVLFILSDQHNAKVLGHKGHPDVRTPNLDRMAAEGVRFDNAVTQNPICTPSRVSFLSGQYCHNHGYYGLSGPAPGGLPSVLGHFRDHGYATAAYGKIHCPAWWIEDVCDAYHDTCGTSVEGRSFEYERFLKERGKLELEDHIGLTEFGDRGRQSMEGRPSNLTFEESQEGWATGRAIEFMRARAAEAKPFCVHVSLPRPHQCTAPSEPFWDMYEGKDLTLPPNAEYEMAKKAPNLVRTAERWRTGEWTLFEPNTFEAGRMRKLRGYLGAVSQVDHAVGLMLDFLRNEHLAKKTIVVYAADHGDYACEHGIMEKAPGICSDAITRIPFLWWAPGRIAEGHAAEEVVEAVDVAATLPRLAGLPALETADGADIAPLLAGRSGRTERVGVTEFPWSRSLRKGRYRLVHYPPAMFAEEYPDGFGELYDLETDPWEMTNLYFDPDFREVVESLRAELLNWLITTTRPTTVHGLFEPPTSPSGHPQRITHYRHSVNADGKLNPKRIHEIQQAGHGGNYL